MVNFRFFATASTYLQGEIMTDILGVQLIDKSEVNLLSRVLPLFLSTPRFFSPRFYIMITDILLLIDLLNSFKRK